jgi:RNA polymerase sigma factor (sigma-70 family)
VTVDGLDWDEIYRTQAPRLRKVIARRVGTAQVDDILQETFARAYRSRHLLDPERPVEPWLTAIAVRSSIDSRQHQQRHMSQVPEQATSPAAEDEVLARQRGVVIAAAFGALKERHRQLLTSVAFEEATPRGLAEQEGVAPEAMRAVLSRARQSFRLAYHRFAEQAGLATLGGSLRPVLTRARLRLLPIERFAPRPDVIAALFATTAIGGALLFTPPPPKSSHPAPMPAGELTARAPNVWTPVATVPQPVIQRGITVQTSVNTPSGDLQGTITHDGPAVDTIWTLRLAPTDYTISLGTDGRTGTLSVQGTDESPLGSNRMEGGATTEDCAENPANATHCAVYSTGEDVAVTLTE